MHGRRHINHKEKETLSISKPWYLNFNLCICNEKLFYIIKKNF